MARRRRGAALRAGVDSGRVGDRVRPRVAHPRDARRRALQRHGYVHEQMTRAPRGEVMRPPAWARLSPLFAQALAGQTVTIRQRSEDGEGRLRVHVRPVRRDGRVVAATMTSRDITAQAQRRAGSSPRPRARLQAILDHSPMAIYMRDLDQRWIVANAETCGIMGKRAEELVGQPMSEAFPPDVYEQLAANDREVIASRRCAELRRDRPRRAHRRDRHVWSLKFPVRDAEGRVVGLGGVSLDVTDRERAARELAAARGALRDGRSTSAPVGMLVSRANGDGTHRGHRVQCRVRADARPRAGRAARQVGAGDRASRTTCRCAGACSTTCWPAGPPRPSCASSTATATTSARSTVAEPDPRPRRRAADRRCRPSTSPSARRSRPSCSTSPTATR